MVKKGKSGAEEIQKMMDNFRSNPPHEIAGSQVIAIKDYLTQKEKKVSTGEEFDIALPKSNVLQFFTEEGSKISVRPSGTEPKIKFYIGTKMDLNDRREFESVNGKLESKLDELSKALGV